MGILRQREWTEAQLSASGFQYYEPRKRLVMAQIAKEVTEIQVTLEVLIATEGDIICYNPGDEIHKNLDDYDHWPVKAELFRQNYKRWDEPNWQPTQAQVHLLSKGCRPFYKAVGVWSLKLPIAIYVQSLESPEPVVVPSGRWLCIGTEGEPYNMSEENFRARYLVPALV